MFSSKLRRFALVLLLSSNTGSSFAGGPMTGGAAEWTQIFQYMQDAEALAEQIYTKKIEYENMRAQLKALEFEYERMKNIDGNLYEKYRKRMALIKYAQNVMTNLHGNLTGQSDAIKKRHAEAQVGGLSWWQYSNYVMRGAYRGADGKERTQVEAEVARIEAEKELLNRTAEHADEVQMLASDPSNTATEKKSLQIISQQLGALLEQNKVILGSLVSLRQSEGKKEMDEKNAATAANANAVLSDTRIQSHKERQDAWFK